MQASSEACNAKEMAAMADSNELLAACKELRDACAACFRVIARHDMDLFKEFDSEWRLSGITHGFGVRADRAIAKAEGWE